MTQIIYSVGSSHVEMHLSPLAKKSFVKVAKMAAKFLQSKDVLETLQSFDAPVLTSYKFGLDALEKIAYVPSKPLHVSPHELASALPLVCAQALNSTTPKRSFKALIHVLVVLGSALPCTLSRRNLPAPETIWDVDVVPEPIVATYNSLREWSYNCDPYAALINLHGLWAWLPVACVNPLIKQLVEDIEVAASIFDTAMKKLTIDESAE